MLAGLGARSAKIKVGNGARRRASRIVKSKSKSLQGTLPTNVWGDGPSLCGGPSEVRFRRPTYRIEPSADVDLGMRFPAEVPRAGRVRGFQVPPENSELRITALNHKPMGGVAVHRSTNFTFEFLKR